MNPYNNENWLFEKHLHQAATNQVRPDLPIEAVSRGELREICRNDLPLLAFSNYALNVLQGVNQNFDFIFVLLNRDGCVLRCFGADRAMEEFKSQGITAGCLFGIDKLGPNAISIGLYEEYPLASVGEENYNLALKKYALYFYPIQISDLQSPFHKKISGGLGLILPREQANPRYIMLTAAAALYTMSNLNMHYWDKQQRASLIGNYGIIEFNIYADKDAYTINNCNDNMGDILGVNPAEVMFAPASAVFDPLPKNKEFWEILSQQKTVSEKELQLSIRGKTVEQTVTTETYHQPSLNIHGIIFYFGIRHRVASDIARRTGNNALITEEDAIGKSPEFLAVMQQAHQIARSDSNVLILGESGSGKDVFAQIIHNSSSRRNKPFIVVNCGALPRDLIASELFGYASGAFTGARRQGNIGKFELANGGTIFLDEIAELPLELQATLLRVVENKQVSPLGSNQVVNVDVKIISATNADIQRMIDQKAFRADLYYRLSTLQLYIPPLRDRGDDIILLAEHFIEKAAPSSDKLKRLSPSAKRLLLSLPWHGNIRELQNLIERIMQLCDEDVIQPEHILSHIHTQESDRLAAAPSAEFHPQKRVGHELLQEAEILSALRYCHGNKSKAAQQLNIDRKTLYRNMQRLGIDY